jgi:hypothetical protein
MGRVLLAMVLVGAVVVFGLVRRSADEPPPKPRLNYLPLQPMDTAGLGLIFAHTPVWAADASLDEVSAAWKDAGERLLAQVDAAPTATNRSRMFQHLSKASLMNYSGEPVKASAELEECRREVEQDPPLAEEWLYSIITYQGITALRRGETENCIMCRGESSCILPISSAAVHLKPEGSRLAIHHFNEYLDQFPDDLEVRWLLNIAHMTLGEHPHAVDPKRLISLDRFNNPKHGIGRFHDIGSAAGIARFNQAGGAILDDFDNDDRLDIVLTSYDPLMPMAFLWNTGDGTFEDRSSAAGVTGQVGGGLQCVQADFDNDGFTDVFIVRGAWLKCPVRPSLLRNNGKGGFTDVTREAGLTHPMNSNCAAWADFDKDGWLDVFVANETGPCRLYRNTGKATFEEVAAAAGVALTDALWKGATWIDYDADGYPDLFATNIPGAARLFHNKGDGTFEDVTTAMGIDGPAFGFSCWAFDYDNDGWPDIFATGYERTLKGIVQGLIGEPHQCKPPALFRNRGGKRFENTTIDAGLDMAFAAMGSNFADLDNDGFLDFYLGTGDPQIATLVPNRMFRNLDGRRFAEITGSSGTGHLQKGHGVAIGDWRRCGNQDILIEMGGAVPGDQYHNVLFRNPGNTNNWLNVKLVGVKTNRSAIGARISVTTAGDHPRTMHRWVSSGSSFGANPLEQHIGIGKATRIASVEVYWPQTGRTQVFRDLGANQYIEITEGKDAFRKRDLKPIPF